MALHPTDSFKLSESVLHLGGGGGGCKWVKSAKHALDEVSKSRLAAHHIESVSDGRGPPSSCPHRGSLWPRSPSGGGGMANAEAPGLEGQFNALGMKGTGDFHDDESP